MLTGAGHFCIGAQQGVRSRGIYVFVPHGIGRSTRAHWRSDVSHSPHKLKAWVLRAWKRLSSVAWADKKVDRSECPQTQKSSHNDNDRMPSEKQTFRKYENGLGKSLKCFKLQKPRRIGGVVNTTLTQLFPGGMPNLQSKFTNLPLFLK